MAIDCTRKELPSAEYYKQPVVINHRATVATRKRQVRRRYPSKRPRQWHNIQNDNLYIAVRFAPFPASTSPMTIVPLGSFNFHFGRIDPNRSLKFRRVKNVPSPDAGVFKSLRLHAERIVEHYEKGCSSHVATSERANHSVLLIKGAIAFPSITCFGNK